MSKHISMICNCGREIVISSEQVFQEIFCKDCGSRLYSILITKQKPLTEFLKTEYIPSPIEKKIEKIEFTKLKPIIEYYAESERYRFANENTSAIEIKEIKSINELDTKPHLFFKLNENMPNHWLRILNKLAISIYKDLDELDEAAPYFINKGKTIVRYINFSILKLFRFFRVDNIIINIENFKELLKVFSPQSVKKSQLVCRELIIYTDQKRNLEPFIAKINDHYCFYISSKVITLEEYDTDYGSFIVNNFGELLVLSLLEDRANKRIKNLPLELKKLEQLGFDEQLEEKLADIFIAEHNEMIKKEKILELENKIKNVKSIGYTEEKIIIDNVGTFPHTDLFFFIITNLKKGSIKLTDNYETINKELLSSLMLKEERIYTYEEIVKNEPFRDFFRELRKNYLADIEDKITIREDLWINICAYDVRYIHPTRGYFFNTTAYLKKEEYIPEVVFFIEKNNLDFELAIKVLKYVRNYGLREMDKEKEPGLLTSINATSAILMKDSIVNTFINKLITELMKQPSKSITQVLTTFNNATNILNELKTEMKQIITNIEVPDKEKKLQNIDKLFSISKGMERLHKWYTGSEFLPKLEELLNKYLDILYILENFSEERLPIDILKLFTKKEQEIITIRFIREQPILLEYRTIIIVIAPFIPDRSEEEEEEDEKEEKKESRNTLLNYLKK